MKIFKYVLVLVLLLPLLFSFSHFISVKANAAIVTAHNLNLLVKVDKDNNQKYGTASTDPCYDGQFSVDIRDFNNQNSVRTVGPFTSKADCSGSVYTVKVYTSPTFLNGQYAVALRTPNKTLNYIDGYYNSTKTHLELNKSMAAASSKSITMKAGDNQVAFGLTPPSCGISAHDGICPSGSTCAYASDLGTYSCKNNCDNNHKNGYCPSGKTCQGTNQGLIYKCVDKTTPTPTQSASKCDLNAPTIAITPATAQVGKRGEKITYKITVTNHDKGVDCPANTNMKLTVDSEKPGSNWIINIGDNTLSVPKGNDTKTTNLFVTSGGAAAENTYSIVIGVRKSGKSASQATARAKYTVNVPGGGNPSPTPTKKPTTNPTTHPSVSPTSTACTKSDPTLSVTSDKTEAKPGRVITYSVKVKNNDTGNCGDRNLVLSKTLPNDNWKGAFDPTNSFSLQAGKGKTVTLPVTSPSSASEGTKTIRIVLKNAGGTQLAATNVNYIVSNDPVNPTPTPSVVPSVTVDPQGAVLDIYVGTDGIGNTKRIVVRKDSHGNDIGGNTNPVDEDKRLNFKVTLQNTDNRTVYEDTNTFEYDSTSQKYHAQISLPQNFQTKNSDTYNLYLGGSRYLTRQYPGSITVTTGHAVTLNNNNFYLITGDINKTGDSLNQINYLDYQVLISCSIYSADQGACNQKDNYKKLSDLNADGVVDLFDMNLWVIEVGNQEGVIIPE